MVCVLQIIFHIIMQNTYCSFQVLDHGVFADEVDDTAGSQLVNDSSVLYCERFIEFLIDMLNQLPTRRYRYST